MSVKVIGIVGSYRKGGIVDRTVGEILKAASVRGAATETIYLTDRHIEFCKNCRTCTQGGGPARGTCVHRDDMDDILSKIEEAGAIVIGSPVNFGNVTAVTQRFIERLVGYAFWPWGQPGPEVRVKDRGKKAVLVTSSAMPAFMAGLFTHARKGLKSGMKALGAAPVGSLHVGMAALDEEQALPADILRKAARLGHKIAAG